jgi:ABC-type dipeptide/oligopeptide/nickel transport system permease component
LIVRGGIVVLLVLALPLGRPARRRPHSLDLPIIAAITFAIGALIAVLNLVADVVHAAADPRVRLHARLR